MTEQQRAADRPATAAGPGPGAGPGTGTGAAGGAATGAPPSGGAPRRPGPGTGPAAAPLRRVLEQKVLGGVCTGLGRYCDMDPVIFRIVLVVLTLTGGLGMVVYAFVWLLVPVAGEEENEARRLLSARVEGPGLTAILCALVGCGLFLSMLGSKDVLVFGACVALLLSGAGYWSRHRGAPGADPLTAQATADAPPEAQAPPVPASFPSWWRDPIVKDGTHVGGTGYLWGPRDLQDLEAARKIARTSRWETAVPKGDGGVWISGWVFLCTLLAGGAVTALTWNPASVGTSLQTGLAAALAVIGTGIGISALFGRTGAGSVMLAVLTAVLLAGVSALPANVSTHWVRTTWRPATATALRPEYRLNTGDATLDLHRLQVAGGRTVHSEVQVGTGRLRIVLPPDVTARLHVKVGLGDLKLPGDASGNTETAPAVKKTVTLPPAAGGRKPTAAGAVDLDLGVSLGEVEVDRAAP